MNNIYIYILIAIGSFNIVSAQWFTIDHDGVLRSYYLSMPSISNENNPSPLIINLHGYGGNATQQLYYSQMNEFALEQNIAVVYPQGNFNSWNVYTFWDNNNSDDVGFIEKMIDTIINEFDIDSDRVYACGMSNGGYMSYRLACDLSDKIAAFGSVTGNFMINTLDIDDCNQQNREIPIIHFHGTNDGVVNYYPPSFDGSFTISESINYWAEYNNLTNQNFESLNSFVDIYTYYNVSSNTKFVHFKITGGGHEWFGDNWGFQTSEELINFFLDYKLSDFINNSIPGDLNGDGIIDILDLIILVNIILSGEYNFMADINEDGIVNILDIVIYKNTILGR